jgi:phage terminase large subunit-like protein
LAYENRANLAPGFFDQIIRKYEGTRLGWQELNAELLEDTLGALWSHAIIDATRLPTTPHLARIVVAIDPAVSSGEDADETGIVILGKDFQGHDYMLADASGKHSQSSGPKLPSPRIAHRADRIVAERNNGGAMVEATIRMVDGNIPVTTLWASRGKVARAKPVSALHEQGRVHHIGTFPQLEDQMCTFTTDFDRARAGYSPDRLDALVWGLTELLVEWGVFEVTRQRAEELQRARQPPPPPQREYAVGSVEWQHQQEQAGESDYAVSRASLAEFAARNVHWLAMHCSWHLPTRCKISER